MENKILEKIYDKWEKSCINDFSIKKYKMIASKNEDGDGFNILFEKQDKNNEYISLIFAYNKVKKTIKINDYFDFELSDLLFKNKEEIDKFLSNDINGVYSKGKEFIFREETFKIFIDIKNIFKDKLDNYKKMTVDFINFGDNSRSSLFNIYIYISNISDLNNKNFFEYKYFEMYRKNENSEEKIIKTNISEPEILEKLLIFIKNPNILDTFTIVYYKNLDCITINNCIPLKQKGDKK